jgi:hypothetical protein
MIGSTKFQLGAHGTKNRLPKGAHEDRITIQNQGLGQPMQTVDVVDEHFSHLASSIGMAQRHKMGVFGKLIHYYHQTIIVPGQRQAINEVHRCHLPGR